MLSFFYVRSCGNINVILKISDSFVLEVCVCATCYKLFLDLFLKR